MERSRKKFALESTLDNDDPWSFQNEFYKIHFANCDFKTEWDYVPLKPKKCNCCEIYYESKSCCGLNTKKMFSDSIF